MRRLARSLVVLALVGAAAPSLAQDRRGPPGGPPPPPEKVVDSDKPAGQRELIQWYGTWEAAKREAKRSERAILLLSAAPQCRGISGIW